MKWLALGAVLCVVVVCLVGFFWPTTKQSPLRQPLTVSKKSETVDLIAFSFDRPMQLYALLESAEKYISGIQQSAVIYRASSKDFATAYEELKIRFPKVQFYAQGENPADDFKPLLVDAVFSSPSQYVVFAVDDILIKDFVDFSECTRALEQTGAYGFYLRLGSHVDYCYMLDKKMSVPPSIEVGECIFAWQFSSGNDDWKYPNTLDMTIYKKSDIESQLRKLKYSNPNDFESRWKDKADFQKVGLYFDSAKAINIPLNRVACFAESLGNRHMKSYTTAELLEKFCCGLKINITSFHQIDNHSPHIEHEIAFIDR